MLQFLWGFITGVWFFLFFFPTLSYTWTKVSATASSTCSLQWASIKYETPWLKRDFFLHWFEVLCRFCLTWGEGPSKVRFSHSAIIYVTRVQILQIWDIGLFVVFPSKFRCTSYFKGRVSAVLFVGTSFFDINLFMFVSNKNNFCKIVLSL